MSEKKVIKRTFTNPVYPHGADPWLSESRYLPTDLPRYKYPVNQEASVSEDGR